MAINNQEAEALFGSPVDVEQGFTEETKQEESNVIPNELQYYFTNDVIAEEQSVFRENNPRPIGWEDGVKPIYVNKDLPLAEQYLQLWQYRTNPPENFTKNQDPEKAHELFKNERKYYEYDGQEVIVPDNEWKITRQFKNLTSSVIHPIFGFDKEREYEFSKELVELGLDEQAQKNLFEATKNLSHVQFPEEGDVSLIQQMENISANLYDFFPDITGLAIWGYQKTQTEKADLQAFEEGEIGYEEYTQQEHVAAAENLARTRYWDKLRSEVPFLAPWKELYKNMIFQATEDYLGEGQGIELDDKQIEAILKEGPYVYQVARIASEALPYVVAIEGTLIKGFGMIRGSKAYDDALEYVAKNTYKHGSPYEAIVAYMERDAIKKLWIDTPKGKSFINGVVKRYDKVNKKMTIIEKSAIEKQIATIEKQIIQADKTNDIAKLRTLSKEKDMLITMHAGLKVNFLGNYTKSIIRNEAYASAAGGACYSVTGSDGLALACELGGAILEPNIHSSVMNLKNGIIFRTAQMLDGLNSINLVSDNVKLWSDKNLKAKFFTGNVEDLMIRDKTTGNMRALTVKEIGSLRVFADAFAAIPVNDRMKIIARMEKAESAMKELKKFLPEEQHKNLNMTIAEMTGLSVLNALDELTKINMKVTNIKPTDLIEANQNLNQSIALIESIDGRVKALLGSTDNPSDELLAFAKKIEQSNFQLREDLIIREEGLTEILKIYGDSLHGGNILDNIDIKATHFEDTIKLLEEFAQNARSPELRLLAEEQIGKITDVTIRHWENVAKDLNGMAGNYVGGFTLQDYMVSDFYDTLKLNYRFDVSQSYKEVDKLSEGVLIDVTDSYKQISDLIEKNASDRIGNLANKLPPGSFNTKMMNILEDGANSSLNKYLMDNDNARVAFAQFIDSAPEKSETMVQAIEALVQKQGKFNATDLNTIFNGLADTLSKTEKYRTVGVEGITKLDIYQALRDGGVDIAINLKPSQAMDLRSALSTLKSKAFQADNKVQSLNYDGMMDKIQQNILDNLPTQEAKNAYQDALLIARDYHVRFDNKDSMLFGWGTMSAPLSVRRTENLQDGTEIVSKSTPDNANSKKIKQDLKITTKEFNVPNYKHKLSKGEFINWGKVLSDPAYAEKWMRDVVEPLIGRPIREGDKILPNQTHILDLTDKDVFQRAQVFKKLLEQELGSYLSLTKTGQALMNLTDKNKILQMARDKKIVLPNKIDINNEIDRVFQITDDFNLLNVNKITDINLGIETASVLSPMIREYSQKITKEIKSDIEKSRKIVQEKLRKIKFNTEKLSNAAIVSRYGANLADPQQFYKAVIEGGNMARFNAMRTSLTEGTTAVMTKDEFDDVARTLYQEWYMKFSNIRVLDSSKMQIDIGSRVDDAAGVIEKGKQAIIESTGKVRNVYQTNLGLALEEFDKSQEVLYYLFGKEGVDSTREVLQVMAAKASVNVDQVNLQNMPKPLSVESWISRIYSINRGVISPRYVLTEAALQKYRVGKTDMIIDLLSQPEAAKIIKSLITDGLSKSPYLDVRLQKFFKAKTVNAILLNEFLSDGGVLDPGTEDSLFGTDSTLGKAFREPFKVEERL